MMHSYFKIPNTVNYDPQQLKKEYKNPNNYPKWLDKYRELKELIKEWSIKKESKVILRCFDGEWKFMQKMSIGNIQHRHYNKKITDEMVRLFRKNIMNVDIFTSHLTHKNERKIVLPNREIDYPMEFVYALLSSKWILNNFKNKISLIGGSGRMKLIKKLMDKEEYRNYINQDKFNEYISVPELQGCQFIDSTIEIIKEGLKNSKSEIVLFGMGISKLGMINKLKDCHNAIFIDIGHGIDCLAGIGNPIRPYFGMWKNYRLKEIDYKKIYFCDKIQNYNDKFKVIYKNSIIHL